MADYKTIANAWVNLTIMRRLAIATTLGLVKRSNIKAKRNTLWQQQVMEQVRDSDNVALFGGLVIRASLAGSMTEVVGLANGCKAQWREKGDV